MISCVKDEFELPTTKNAIKKKTKRTPLQQQFPPENDENKPTIEQIYQKKTQLEHILLRPDTYSKCSNDVRPLV